MLARRPGTAAAAALCALALSLATAELLAPAWAGSLDLDVWNLPAVREDARLTDEHAVEVEARRVRIIRESEATGHTANRLIEGSITLTQATDELEPVLRNRAGFECAWLHDPVPTFRHGVARYVMNRVAAELADDPERCTAVSARLKSEYAALE